jgi:hypothetical protein
MASATDGQMNQSHTCVAYMHLRTACMCVTLLHASATNASDRSCPDVMLRGPAGTVYTCLHVPPTCTAPSCCCCRRMHAYMQRTYLRPTLEIGDNVCKHLTRALTAPCTDAHLIVNFATTGTGTNINASRSIEFGYATGELQSADRRQPSAQQGRPSAQAVPTVTVGVASSA